MDSMIMASGTSQDKDGMKKDEDEILGLLYGVDFGQVLTKKSAVN